MEQELSWSGLALCMSIAFFIVIGSAATLRFAEHSISTHANDHVLNERLRQGSTMAEEFFSVPGASAATLTYKATPSKDTEYFTFSKGQTSTIKLTYKNSGSTIWKASEVSFETGPFLKAFSKVQTTAWKKYYQPVALSKDVKPGQSITISFPIQTPNDVSGTIQENFQLVVKDQPIDGSLVRTFMTINQTTAPIIGVAAPVLPASSSVSAPSTGAAAAPATQPDFCIATIPSGSVTTPNPSEYNNCNTSLNESGAGTGIAANILINVLPIIRVGLFSTLAPQPVIMDKVFDIYAGSQLLAANQPAGSSVTLSYDVSSASYKATTASGVYTAKAPLRLIPKTNGGVATLSDYRVGQKPQDNRFRNIIELNYSTTTKTAWIINELPVDDYVKGLAETTNASPVEFQKVMAVIARTYSLYHYLRGVGAGLSDASTKHASEHFHVDAVYDQVYRGYNSEMRLTGLTQAVEATRGIAVTYNSALAITPYFSNSDGRTRDWTEVWGGSGMPWLKSVVVSEDAGQILYGHGVGLSARGALLMVTKGSGWQDVLKYFYTGIQLQKIY